MILEIIKKQGLIFWRSPQQLLLLILLPIVLIVILSISLDGFITGDSIAFNAKVALIDSENEANQFDQFVLELEESDFPEEKKEQIIQIASDLNPLVYLRDDVFGDMEDTIELDVVREGKENLNMEQYTSVIEVSENFTYETLAYMFLDYDEPGAIKMYHNEDEEINAAAMDEVITSFQEQLTMYHYALKNDINPQVLFTNHEFGERKSIEKLKPIDSKQYYTIGMAVMNVLYIATAISSFTFMEKENHIFNRFIWANVSGREYFTGVFVSGVIFAIIQLLLIFGFAWWIFGVSWSNIVAFLGITTALALAVGGFSVFLTSITYRINSEGAINLFSSMIIAILALLGGSFFPIGDLSAFIQAVGDYTPNGAAMTAYLQLLRGETGFEVGKHILYLIVVAVVLLLISIFYFPKRGESS